MAGESDPSFRPGWREQLDEARTELRSAAVFYFGFSDPDITSDYESAQTKMIHTLVGYSETWACFKNWENLRLSRLGDEIRAELVEHIYQLTEVHIVATLEGAIGEVFGNSKGSGFRSRRYDLAGIAERKSDIESFLESVAVEHPRLTVDLALEGAIRAQSAARFAEANGFAMGESAALISDHSATETDGKTP